MPPSAMAWWYSNIDHGVVRDVEGDAPLATVIRVDRDVAHLTAEIASLYERLHDVSEHVVERLASRT